MGHSTRYLGHLDITPALNPSEVMWLRAYCRTHRALHPDDPYAVPMNPGAEHQDHPLAERLPGGGWVIGGSTGEGLTRCDWSPTPDGRALCWVETEKSNTALTELRYLIDHFLRPEALASTDGREDFAEFTFDHTVAGTIASEREDGRLSLLLADDNELTELVLVPGADSSLP